MNGLRLTVAIMAGGKSSRMGTDKAFVEISGKPIIEHLLERVSQLGQDETILTSNTPEKYAHLDMPIYSDIFPGKGSLGGIYSAIQHSKSEYTLVVACDMPFVQPQLLHYMIGLIDDDEAFDVIVPRVDNFPQGLLAIYNKKCLEYILADIESNKLKVIGFYGKMNVRYIDELEYRPFDLKGISFYNINTPDDLEKAQQLAGKS